MDYTQYPVITVLKGRTEKAEYKHQVLAEYRDNPLIEALPNILSEVDVVSMFANYPDFSEDEISLEPSMRLHCVQRLYDYVEVLPLHLRLEQVVSRMIRRGYKARNPLGREYAQHLRQKNVLENPVIKSTADAFTLFGISGLGKSTAVERILTMYPQVIVHSQYQSNNLTLYQLVWLKIDCPHDGSIRGLCLSFFQAVDSILGTSHYKENCRSRKSAAELIPLMAKVASQVCLGMLIIDEIQNLSRAKSGGHNETINFFVSLVNNIGLPIFIVGTYKAVQVFSDQLRNSRRGCGQGGEIASRMEHTDEWRLLIEGMWKYQWIRKPAELTEEMDEAIYDESQGITDLAIKLFMLAQWEAISNGTETITPTLIHTVAKKSLGLVEPVVRALRENNLADLARYEDLFLPKDYINGFYEKSLSEVERNKRLNLIRESQQSLKLQRANEKVNYIVEWLAKGGFGQESVRKVVESSIDELGSKDLATLCQIILKRIMDEKLDKDLSSSNKKEKRQKNTNENDGLLSAVESGRKRKMPPYEALKTAGHIRGVQELNY